MQWVPAQNCSLNCPLGTICKRPLEFLEPLYCIHKDFSIPEDLLASPCTVPQKFALYWPMIVTVLLIIMIVLQVGLMIIIFCFPFDFLSSLDIL